MYKVIYNEETGVVLDIAPVNEEMLEDLTLETGEAIWKGDIPQEKEGYSMILRYVPEAVTTSLDIKNNQVGLIADYTPITGWVEMATAERVEAIESRVTEVENVIKYNTPEFFWYGVEKQYEQASPDLKRIGYLDNHRVLPYHNRIRPCVVKDDRTIAYFLDNNDIRKKADGTPAKLDGTDGQLMVYYPSGYHILNTVQGKEVWAVGLTPFSIDGVDAEYVPAFVVSMDYATLKKDGNKLSCVISDNADYAGSGSGATKGGIGYPRTGANNYNYTLYARSRGDGWVNSFAFFEMIKTSLMYIEFATYCLHKKINNQLSDLGYKQGGLGEGPWNWSNLDWSLYNGFNPIVKIGEVQMYLSNIGNTGGTGVYQKVIAVSDTKTCTTNFPCWRWCSNLYGHLWRWDAGVDIEVKSNADGGTSTVYITKDPRNVIATNNNDFTFVDKYDRLGLISRSNGYAKKFTPSSAYIDIVGGGNSTWCCAYMWTSFPGSGRERRGFLSGASLGGGGEALRATARSLNCPSFSDPAVGSGLSAYVVEMV